MVESGVVPGKENLARPIVDAVVGNVFFIRWSKETKEAFERGFLFGLGEKIFYNQEALLFKLGELFVCYMNGFSLLLID